MPQVAPEVREATRAEVRRLHGDGLTAREIARAMGKNPKSVYTWLDELGLARNPARRRPPNPTPAPAPPPAEDDLHPDEAYVLAQMEGVAEERTVAQHRAVEAYKSLPAAEPKPGARRRSPRKLSAYEERWLDRELEKPMLSRCGPCGWHASGPARDVIRAFEEHRERCPAVTAAVAA